MRRKASFLGVVGIALVLALIGLWREVNPTHALIPQPVQPFGPEAPGGVDTTALGADVDNYTVTTIIRGERIALPWIFSAPGFELEVDKNITDGNNVGDVFATLDAFCDSANTGDADVMAKNVAGPPWTPFDWIETTTAVEGGSDAFLKTIMPPFSFLVRHTATITNLWLGGTYPLTLPSTQYLNTVYTNVPWSANGSAFIATTKMGGQPLPPSAAAALCLDTPQTSTSRTEVYRNPPLQSDSGRPCQVGEQCNDSAVNGLWTQPIINASSSGTTTVPVTTKINSNGPQAGNYRSHWEIEVTQPFITASWSPAGADPHVANATGPVPATGPVSLPLNMSVSCTAGAGAREGLIVLKNIFWPIAPTKDPYLDDNAATFVVRVICDGQVGSPLVDKEVVWIKAVSVAHPGPLPSQPDHLQLLLGEAAVVGLDELKSNHHTAPVAGHEWLVAEVSHNVNPAGDLAVMWLPPIELDPGGNVNPTACTSGEACIEYEAVEQPGQMDVLADLHVACPLETPPGLYSVVVKAIDVPQLPLGEAKPADNANRAVIDVWCFANETDWGISKDTIDDGSGLYPRWTIFQSDPDDRKSYQSPPSFRSDATYIEHTIDLACYWMDADGCSLNPDGSGSCNNAVPANDYIDAAESWQDHELVALGGIPAVDSDGDCLAQWQSAQPGHPLDPVDEPTGSNCGAVPWSGAPNAAVIYSTAADEDCDGLLDGIEKAWGSNPLAADSDGDGADDFVEMFQFTNPLNPDTDGDGYLDKPDEDYNPAACANALDDDSDTKVNDGCPAVGAPETLTACNLAVDDDSDGWVNDGCPVVTATGEGDWGETTLYADDNCPGIYNPDQTNTDGVRRLNGPVIAGEMASNPNQDKLGDACDPDDDNDLSVDVAEDLDGDGVVDVGLETNPKNADTDGDRCIDGVEGFLGKDPKDPLSKCPASLTLDQAKYFRSCHWNLPVIGYEGGAWDAKYSNPTDPERTELDADGDGVNCLSGLAVLDKDSDNGNGGSVAAPAEVLDAVEIMIYGTLPTNKDTDGDGCEDWVEMMDINGSRGVDIADQLSLARRVVLATGYGPDPISDKFYDLSGDGYIDITDQLLMARNSCTLKLGVGGCPACPAEN